MTNLPFIKMHGLGNDFVVFDGRTRPVALSMAQARAIADRRTGVGCDQLIVVEPPRNGRAEVFMRIHNADGGEVAACGNGSRCVAAMIMEETGSEVAVIETASALLEARAVGDGMIAVDLGPASLDWRDIPLAGEADTLHLAIEEGPLTDPVAVNVGNPHAVFFVDDAEAVPLADLGPRIEHHPLFPERTNVEAAQILNSSRMRLRVWERGVGITRACGTGAAAAVVAAIARDLMDRAAEVVVDGGVMGIEWRGDDHVVMTGPAATSFAGTLDVSVLS